MAVSSFCSLRRVAAPFVTPPLRVGGEVHLLRSGYTRYASSCALAHSTAFVGPITSLDYRPVLSHTCASLRFSYFGAAPPRLPPPNPLPFVCQSHFVLFWCEFCGYRGSPNGPLC